MSKLSQSRHTISYEMNDFHLTKHFTAWHNNPPEITRMTLSLSLQETLSIMSYVIIPICMVTDQVTQLVTPWAVLMM